MMDLNDFETAADLEAPQKLIGTFFGNPQNYYRLTSRPREQFEAMFDVDVLDEEVKALHGLIQKKHTRYDDRRFAIEMQFDNNISIVDEKPICIILPETYLANATYAKIVEDAAQYVLTYPVYPLRKEMYYYAIYLKLDELYKTLGAYNV